MRALARVRPAGLLPALNLCWSFGGRGRCSLECVCARASAPKRNARGDRRYTTSRAAKPAAQPRDDERWQLGERQTSDRRASSSEEQHARVSTAAVVPERTDLRPRGARASSVRRDVQTTAPGHHARLHNSEGTDSADTAREPARHNGSRSMSSSGNHADAGPVEVAAVPLDAPETFVPRAASITDGEWNRQDAQLVQAASEDAGISQPRAAAAPVSVAGTDRLPLLCQSVADLAELAVVYGHAAYRGKQLQDALLHGAHTLDDALFKVPADLLQQLRGAGVLTGRSRVHREVAAPDGTRKLLLQLHDGRVVETVGIPMPKPNSTEPQLTVCVSSQVGCPMRCTFCATGKGGWARNLTAHEIVDQVLHLRERYQQRVSNVVFMGMGEPLLNLRNVLRAYEFINQTLGVGARNITISTVGVPNALAQLAAARLRATLAVSLHAPNQALRERLVPSARAFPLDALLAECRAYFRATGRRVTFEYTLLADVNDGKQQAQELVQVLRHQDMVSHVNLIPWNPVEESQFQRPSMRRVSAFKDVLQHAGVEVSVRVTRGLEAAAACGQLRNQHQKAPLEEAIALG